MKIFNGLLIAAAVLFAGNSFARTLEIGTGNYVFDRYRNVDIDAFDYFFSIDSIVQTNGSVDIILEDGSIWRLSKPQGEKKSFFKTLGVEATENFAKEIVSTWNPGEVIIFHKLVNR